MNRYLESQDILSSQKQSSYSNKKIAHNFEFFLSLPYSQNWNHVPIFKFQSFVWKKYKTFSFLNF